MLFPFSTDRRPLSTGSHRWYFSPSLIYGAVSGLKPIPGIQDGDLLKMVFLCISRIQDGDLLNIGDGSVNWRFITPSRIQDGDLLNVGFKNGDLLSFQDPRWTLMMLAD